jgi:uncharacterized membrane protein YhaH (DUF805 family)
MALNPSEREGGEAAAAEPITYPLPFLKVLLSFRGRLNRRAFWLKGVLPTVIIGGILHGLIGGIVMFMLGASVIGGIADAIGPGKFAMFTPTSQFQSVQGRTVGVVTADAEGTRLEVELAAPRDTQRIAREVVVSGRRLSVTAAQKADKAIGYDLTFAWRNLPSVPAQEPAPMSLASQVVAGLGAVLSLLLMWPWFAIAVKRFHDRDQSGWWSIVGLVPLIGMIVMIVVGCLKGTDGENRFGPDPLAAGA